MNKLYSWRDLKDYKNPNEDTADGFYHFGKDVYNFPNCWCYVVWSRRGPGKTYSQSPYLTDLVHSIEPWTVNV